jgi:hypothetical protein
MRTYKRFGAHLKRISLGFYWGEIRCKRTEHTQAYGYVCYVSSVGLTDLKKIKGTVQKFIALSIFANWIFRNKVPRFAGVMNPVIQDVEVRRNPFDVMELDMTDWAADVI